MFNFGNYSSYSDYIKPGSFGWKYTDEHKGENHPCYTIGKTAEGSVVLNMHNSNGDISSTLKMSQEALGELIKNLQAHQL
jgi:hypothetical protein